jgi:CHASE3 domain sensor protein
MRKQNNLREIEKSLEQFGLQEQNLADSIKQVESKIKNPPKSVKSDSSEKKLLDLNRSLNDLTIALRDKQAEHAKVEAQIEQKQQMIDESYLPRQQQLQLLIRDSSMPHQEEDREYSSHL